MKQITLDAIDLKLLDFLQTNASISNQAMAERVHISPPTCLRRVKALRDSGLIEHQIAILNTDKLAAIQGHGLTALVEITLDRQGAEHLEAFEVRAVQPRIARARFLFGGLLRRHACVFGFGKPTFHARCERA